MTMACAIVMGRAGFLNFLREIPGEIRTDGMDFPSGGQA